MSRPVLFAADEPERQPRTDLWALNPGALTAGCAPLVPPVWFTINATIPANAPAHRWQMTNTAAAAPWPNLFTWVGEVNR